MTAAALSTMAQVSLRYQTRYSKSQVSGIIKKLEDSSDKFRRDFDKAMDNSRRNGSNAEDRYNDNVRDFENSLDQLRREFNRTNSWWEVRNQVQEVINDGQTVNSMMNSISFRRSLERQWNSMRTDLNTLADTFDLPGLNGGGWNGGGWNNGGGNNGGGWGGQQGNVPSWAIGSFNGRNPGTGGNITLAITSSGGVTIFFDNVQTANASIYKDRLDNNGIISKITQLNNGIRTTRMDNGEVIDYYRSGNGNGGQQGNVPSWAIGTFYGRNPQTGGTITLSIQSSGSVAITFDNSGVTYASVYGSTMTNNGIVSKLAKLNNGISTTRVDNGERINYYTNNNNNGGGWNGGNGNGNNGNKVTPPTWAQGTFYGTAPNGAQITLTISNNGDVSANIGGGISYGSYMSGNMINMGDSVSRVSKQGNGFTTTRTDNGERIVYSR